MTDEEFERIKEAEKQRLREQKRLRSTLESLKRRNEVQKVVRRMSRGAQQLLRKTGKLADELASQAARQAARLEVAVDEHSEEASLYEDEEILREERAEAVVDRVKTANEPRASRSSTQPSPRSDETGDADAEDEDDDEPDKTIGRMGNMHSGGSA